MYKAWLINDLMKFQNARTKLCKKYYEWHLDLYLVMYFNLENCGDACYSIRVRMYVCIDTCILPVYLQFRETNKKGWRVEKILQVERE